MKTYYSVELHFQMHFRHPATGEATARTEVAKEFYRFDSPQERSAYVTNVAMKRPDFISARNYEVEMTREHAIAFEYAMGL